MPSLNIEIGWLQKEASCEVKQRLHQGIESAILNFEKRSRKFHGKVEDAEELETSRVQHKSI